MLEDGAIAKSINRIKSHANAIRNGKTRANVMVLFVCYTILIPKNMPNTSNLKTEE